MNKSKQFLNVLFLSLCWITVLVSACPYKVCECTKTETLCQHLNLSAIPPITGETLLATALYFDLGVYPPHQTEITFLDNPITTIDASAFDDSSTTLRTLMFSNAKFTKIPDAFLHLNALEYLDMTNIPILDWNDQAMKQIGLKLETIYLENVGLTTWPNWTQYFSQLFELSIVATSFSFIPDNAFEGVTNSLKSLSLINCKLATVPKAFSTLQIVQSIQLMNNKITNITSLSSSHQLYSLSLNNNSIYDSKALSDILRPHGATLSDVDLVSNHLTSIPDLSFLTKVGSLDLSTNRISDPSSGALPSSLYGLDLRNNFLTFIPEIYFTLPNTLSMLLAYNVIANIRETDFPTWVLDTDFSYNQITELTDKSFPQNCSITTLNLNNNPLVKISELAFKGLSRLSDLYIQRTRLTRLPLTLGSLQSLTSLDMIGNTGLVCTCLEKGLEAWMTKSPDRFILGTCGEIRIYEFFVTLSPSCPSQSTLSDK